MHGKSNFQGSLPQANEDSGQQVINPAINPALPQKQELHRAPITVFVPQNHQDPNGDCHMQGESKVLKYFEQETPSIEQPPSADAEDPAELTVVNPSPLTAIDSSSILEESQELELIVELGKQLAITLLQFFSLQLHPHRRYLVVRKLMLDLTPI